MPEVKAPNGDIYDLPEATASGLVNGHESEWEYVAQAPSTAKKAAAKPPQK